MLATFDMVNCVFMVQHSSFTQILKETIFFCCASRAKVVALSLLWTAYVMFMIH